ncbi:vomeronasal type-2 receptor [Pontoporia blainvillei]|uniref:Vomeronasal type-2 receptor n=1 Tax=Pontoporia blainvillei TaxID=48723 RepID=A0ABX0S6C6_PONBL|nr:vomeronasal type-2 receptor [Pontoporia blainvillei]
MGNQYVALTASCVLMGMCHGNQVKGSVNNVVKTIGPNAQKSECVMKEVEFPAYDEVLGFTLVILSIFGALVVSAVTVEIGICTAYLVLEPPRVYKNMESQNIKIILECYEGSVEFLCSVFGMDVFLALLYFLTTLVARQLLDNYYEGKCITFGMLVFFIVCISFVPAYLSTKGKFKVAVEIFAILASSYGLLGCIFAAKCFIILLRPKRNMDEIVGGRVPTVEKNIQLTSASVSSELNNAMVSTVQMSRVMGCMCPSELQWWYWFNIPFQVVPTAAA